MKKSDIPEIIKGYETLEYYDEVMGWFPYHTGTKYDPKFDSDIFRIRRLSKEEQRFHNLVKPKEHCTKVLSKIRNDIAVMISKHGNGLLVNSPDIPIPSDNAKNKYLTLCRSSMRYKNKIEAIDKEMHRCFEIIVKQKTERDG